MDILKAVREAGVVGAGGAGFPTHVKLDARVEYVLVYECTGRLIPAGGIPLQVGTVVHNSESLYNIAEAIAGSVTAVNGAIIIEQS